MVEINEHPVLKEEETALDKEGESALMLNIDYSNYTNLQRRRWLFGVEYPSEMVVKYWKEAAIIMDQAGVSPTRKLLPSRDKDTSIQRIIRDASDKLIIASTSCSDNRSVDVAGSAEKLELLVVVSDHWFEHIPAESNQLEPLQVPEVFGYLNVTPTDLQMELRDRILQRETTDLSPTSETLEKDPIVEINEHPSETEETGIPLYGCPNVPVNDLQTELQDGIFQQETILSPIDENPEQGSIVEINGYPLEVETGTPLADKQKEIEMIDILFLTAMLPTEVASASFEQLHQPELALAMALFGLLLCLVEITYKGKKEGAKFKCRSFPPWFYVEDTKPKLFGTTNLYFELVGAIWQVVHSAIGCICARKHSHNPIEMTIIMALFCGCRLIEKLVNKVSKPRTWRNLMRCNGNVKF